MTGWLGIVSWIDLHVSIVSLPRFYSVTVKGKELWIIICGVVTSSCVGKVLKAEFTVKSLLTVRGTPSLSST